VRVVVALGGNALSRPGERAEPEVMRARLAEAAGELAAVAKRHELVVTHGNGPNVGLLSIQTGAAAEGAALDVLGAENEGMIGFLIEEALASRLPEREVAVLVTQVVVDAEDPAFKKPEEPIGPVYDARKGAELAATRGWTMAKAGEGMRRVVPCPKPLAIREIGAIRKLVDAGVVVVCAGGGGIPVVLEERIVRGVAAVVDKDLTAALLAEELGADALVLLSDVPAIYADWPKNKEPIARAAPEAIRRLRFARGTMAPKVEAACRFALATGKTARIGALGQLEAVLAGRAGTAIRRRG
jgi:carbamate kinase